MLLTTDATIIANLLYVLDINIRNDLHKGMIADERDYVSRLATHFNYPFGVFNTFQFNQLKIKSKWFATVNSGHHERKFGCDSMIIFKSKNKVKIGLFEAKWPRIIINPNYQWDYTDKTTKSSHFTSQIIRQSKWTDKAAIWEMFFYEDKVGTFNSPFDKNGSTCIKHKFAKKLIDVTPSLKTIWDNPDLISLIKSEQTKAFNGTNETNLYTIIFDILTCNLGEAIDVTPTTKTITLESNEGNDKARIPLISFVEGDNIIDQNIEGFMRETGLSFFQQMDIATERDSDQP